MKVQSIACMKCHKAELIREDSDRLKGKWPAWEPGLQDFKCPHCGGGVVWATEPRDEGIEPERPARDAIYCFHARGEDGWSMDVLLYKGEPRGEVRAYQHDALKWTHEIGLEEIAIFASNRWDLVGQYLDRLMKDHTVH